MEGTGGFIGCPWTSGRLGTGLGFPTKTKFLRALSICCHSNAKRNVDSPLARSETSCGPDCPQTHCVTHWPQISGHPPSPSPAEGFLGMPHRV